MINFKSVEFINFLSVGNAKASISLNANHVTAIVGKNGQGKSLIMDAIAFALFDKAFRKINKSQLVNSVNKKGTVVELEFEAYGNDYKVIRGIKPNKFEIYKNGELVPVRDDMKSYQKDFEADVLRMTFKTFSQFIVIGSATFEPFMKLDAADRRKIVEDLLDCQVFSTMALLCKGRLDQAKDDVASTKGELYSIEQSIESLEGIIKMNSSSNAEKVNSNLTKIENLKVTIEELKGDYAKEAEKLKQLKEMLAEIPVSFEEAENKRVDVRDKISKCNHSLAYDKKQEAFFETNDTCPTCTQVIEEGFKSEIMGNVRSAIKKTNTDLEKHNNNLTKVNDILQKIKFIMDDIRTSESFMANIKNDVHYRRGEIESLETANEALSNKASTEQAQEKLNAFQAQLEALTKKYDESYKNLANLQESALHLKDNGMKSVIVAKYIPKINELVNATLEKLDFFCSFELDEQFNETVKSRYRDVFSYDSFSEGEKMRINLAIIFAFREIAKQRNSVSSNLLILDEVFDSSLDDFVVEELMSLVTEQLAKDQNIFVISHNSSTIDKFDKVIKVQKSGNFTEYKEM